MNKLALITATLLASAAAPASAAPIISENFSGGFGVFDASEGAGTIVITRARPGYQACCGATGSDAALDNPFVVFGSGDARPRGALMTEFATTLGALYTLTFRAGAFGGGTDTLNVLFGGVTRALTLTANNNADTTFNTYSYSFTGTGSTSALAFSTRGPGAGIDPVLDDVVVDVAAVPEPQTWGLMLLGMGMVGAGLRSRRRSATVTYA